MYLTCKHTVFGGQESSPHPEFAVRTVGLLLCLLRLVDQLLDCFLGQVSGAMVLNMHHLPAELDLVHIALRVCAAGFESVNESIVAQL